MVISNNLKEFRIKKKLTQEELSMLSGVSRTTIINLERGNSDVVLTDTLIKLSNALQEPVCNIFFTQNV